MKEFELNHIYSYKQLCEIFEERPARGGRQHEQQFARFQHQAHIEQISRGKYIITAIGDSTPPKQYKYQVNVGETYGHLTIIFIEKDKCTCQCDCGNTYHTTSSLLATGHRKSCGCRQRQSPNRHYKTEFTPQEIERSKMTPKLRYEILCRDNFHCVLCGRGVEDGVKLAIDHITPVSKGGFTEKENLRTLCFECNLGKGDQEIE